MSIEKQGDFDDISTLGRPDAALSGDSTFALLVVDGRDRGRSFAIDEHQPTRQLIGQSPACEIRLTDPEVSRRHAAIEVTRRVASPRLRVLDLDSKNGTFVDGVSVTGAFLRVGETLRVGSTTFRVDAAPALARGPLSTATHFGRVIGVSAEMRRLYPLCAKLAASAVPVVIEGETGTGKEQLAEALHELGPRAAGPFVVFDCTAVPPNLVESELFGHERGAFTGAVGTRKGLFEQAHRGTLLIDEIGDLDPTLQPKLLRAIERSEVRRVGSSETLRVDVRVLAATRRDLDHEVQTGRFRDDLFHRLAVTRIELPPLRQRWGDVVHLARHFWKTLADPAHPAPSRLFERWSDYAWPGNVRELRNAVVRQIALGELSEAEAGPPSDSPGPPSGHGRPGEAVLQDALNDAIGRLLAAKLPLPVARRRLLEEFERRYIDHTLAEHGGNTAAAAAASGIARRYFQLLLARRGR
jgi:DNA-binding NtrC family response regulator